MRKNGMMRVLLFALALSMLFSFAACGGGGEDVPADSGGAVNPGSQDAPADVQETPESPSEAPVPDAESWEKPVLHIYQGQIVVRTPEGELVVKEPEDKLPEETLVEILDPDEAIYVFYDSEGNRISNEPTIGNTCLTHTDLVTMTDSDLATYGTRVKIAGYWELRSSNSSGGPGEFGNIRIDDDGYVYAELGGKMYSGLWWEDFTNGFRLCFSLRPEQVGGRNMYIFEYEVHPTSLTLRYVDNTNQTSGAEYVYSREPLDYSRFTALPGHEDLPEAEIEPYIHGIWYCDDPYLDYQKLPYKVIFTPSFEAENTPSFIRANINDTWTYAWVGEGELMYDNLTLQIEIIDADTMRISRQYFQGSFEEDELGYVEGIYRRISYYANMTHPYNNY